MMQSKNYEYGRILLMLTYQYRVLPCPNFSQADMLIIQRYGFLTFPQFVDNGFKTEKGLDWNRAKRNAEVYHPIFFIAHDDDPLRDLDFLHMNCANIILPLHKKADLDTYKEHFEWIGFPNKSQLRDYDIDWFIQNTRGIKRWWLGLLDFPIAHSLYTKEFHGLDSTLPELCAGKFGLIWQGWRKRISNANKLHWRVIFEQNVQNFRLFLDQCQKNSSNLVQHLTNPIEVEVD